MLPTLGAGLALFVVPLYLFDWVSKIALFASVLVFNPLVNNLGVKPRGIRLEIL